MKVTTVLEFDLENNWQRMKMDILNNIEYLPTDDLKPIFELAKAKYEEALIRRKGLQH